MVRQQEDKKNLNKYEEFTGDNLHKYMVCPTLGRIINKTGHYIIGSIEPITGFLKFYVNHSTEKKKYLNHILIWEHVHGPTPQGYKIKHKDGDRVNNKISNLKLIKKSVFNKNHIYKKICLEDINTGKIKKFDSINNAMLYTGLNKSIFYKLAILREPIPTKNHIYIIKIEN